MHATVTLTPSQLPGALLDAAVVRPVMIWGAPGSGKSSLVEQFAASLGLPCVSLLGTQLAPEDIIGVPQIVETPNGARSRFCPPTLIAKEEPFVLFLDELNGSSPEVQKAFYSLVLDRRIGEYELPEGSIVIAAGNRAQDNAIVRPMSTALVNRMLHVHLSVSAKDWLVWAGEANLHPWVMDYIKTRPDHLVSPPPKTEEPFSTPRSWHMLSDLLHSSGADISDDLLKAFASGCVTPAHAGQFQAYVRQIRNSYSLDSILKGAVRWPSQPSDTDVLYFLAQSFRARLAKELPRDKTALNDSTQHLAHRAKGLLVELAEISVEAAQLVVSVGGHDGDSSDGGALPTWFFTEVVRDLPRLVKAR